MGQTAPGVAVTLPRRWTGLAIFLGVAGAFMRTAAPAATPGDAGEFIAAAGTLSLPHSPSFPLYVLTSHLFVTLVPFAAVAHRVVLFSCVCGAGAATLLFLAADTISEHRLASVACALAAATSSPLWMNALVAEVFALHAMMVAGFIYLLAVAVRSHVSVEKAAVLFGFLGGVAAANHQTVAFVAPAYLVFLWLIGSGKQFARGEHHGAVIFPHHRSIEAFDGGRLAPVERRILRRADRKDEKNREPQNPEGQSHRRHAGDLFA